MDERACTRAFPGRRSFSDLRVRVTTEVERIRREHDGGSVAAVTHSGVVRAVLADVLGLSDGAIFRIDPWCGGVTLIEWIGDQPILRCLNVSV